MVHKRAGLSVTCNGAAELVSVVCTIYERGNIMGTLNEEIFSHKRGRVVRRGKTVVVGVDHFMSHDPPTPLAIEAFQKLAAQTGGKVFDRSRAHLIFDHIIPAST